MPTREKRLSAAAAAYQSVQVQTFPGHPHASLGVFGVGAMAAAVAARVAYDRLFTGLTCLVLIPHVPTRAVGHVLRSMDRRLDRRQYDVAIVVCDDKPPSLAVAKRTLARIRHTTEIACAVIVGRPPTRPAHRPLPHCDISLFVPQPALCDSASAPIAAASLPAQTADALMAIHSCLYRPLLDAGLCAWDHETAQECLVFGRVKAVAIGSAIGTAGTDFGELALQAVRHALLGERRVSSADCVLLSLRASPSDMTYRGVQLAFAAIKALAATDAGVLVAANCDDEAAACRVSVMVV